MTTAALRKAPRADPPAAPARPLLGTGQVRHARVRPVAHRFAYRTYFLMLPLRSLRETPCRALARNRFGLISFHDADHGAGGPDCLAWLDGLLAEAGIDDADGEVWLHCYPRVLGYAFKPVSFWYCHRADSSLAAVVVEVNNTFGERHCYLLNGPGLRPGAELTAAKVFHVSPFCETAGAYRFRFLTTGLHPLPAAARIEAARTIACIDHHDAAGLLIRTSVSGVLEPLTQAAQRAAFFATPWMTLGVIARIHWQALQLWKKRVPFFRKPAPPRSFVSR
jgi:DUF1365 family protein